MNFKTLTAILFLIFTFHQSASAYSSIFTIDGWSAAQLKEAGITVATWKHDQIGEEPPKNWVKITYDTSKIGDQNVIMTLNVDAFNQNSTTSFRVERKKGEAAELSLIFAVEERNAEDASIQIIAPQQLAKGADRPYGDPGFGGYSLPLSKIMKIACEVAVNKPVEEVEKKSEDRQPAVEEEKALKPTKVPSQDIPSSRPMTPEEEQKYGYNVTSPEENEKRQKEIQRFLPGFAKLKPLLARISADQESLIFVGLPHQEYFSDEHAAELKTKQTVTRHGSAFYQTPLKLKAEDARKLNVLIQHPDAFIPYQGFPARVGFKPDFSLVWDDNGKPIEIQICFKNGGEVKAYLDNTFVFCQLEGIKGELKSMLKNYHQNLPQSAR